MRLISQNGTTVHVVSGPDPSSGDLVQYALMHSSMLRRVEGGQRWPIGQLYGLVSKELMNTRYIFRGLQRPMRVKENGLADQDKLAFVWKPKSDYKFVGEVFGTDGSLLAVPAMPGLVFFVLVSSNVSKDEFPDVAGWIEHWGWIDEDPNSPSKPIDHESRYKACIWSKKP